MQLIGYGVMKEGKPSGIWPLPLQRALERCRRLQAEHRGRWEVVPIYVGAPQTVNPAPVKPTPA